MQNGFSKLSTASIKYVGPGEVMAAGIVLPLVCTTIVGLRFYVRKTQKVSIGIDDWLTIPALVSRACPQPFGGINLRDKVLIIGMGICFIVGMSLLFALRDPVLIEWFSGVAKGVMGYPTTLPAYITPANEASTLIPSYVTEAKVSG